MDRRSRSRSARDLLHTRRRFVGTTAGSFAGLLAMGRMATSAQAQDGTPVPEECPPTTSEEAAAIAQAYVDAFNTGDVDALDALLAPNYRHSGALVADQDREIHKERMLTNLEAFPDGHRVVQDITANGDLVGTRWVFTGTLQGPYAGVEPEGQPVAVRGAHIHRISCGQIVETWNSGDGLGLLRQIGAIPSDGVSPRTPVDVAASPIAASPAADACPAGTAEENAEIGRRWTEDALDQRNLDLLDEFVADELLHHSGLFVDSISREELKENLAHLYEAFPDIRFTADVIVADEDGAYVRWTGKGTNDGEFQGQPPTGRAVEFTGINSYRIVCGQIVEGWSDADSLHLLRQLGMIPDVHPGPATPTN